MLCVPRFLIVLVGCVFSILGFLCSFPARAQPECVPPMRKGSVCSCKLADLHPTQMAIGELHVKELAQEGFDHLAKHVARKKHAMIVFGPTGASYIVDGHHHARAMTEIDATGLTTCEIADVPSALPADPGAFWVAMEGLHLARLEGTDGLRHPGDYPPDKLIDLVDDPFRSLSSWIEDRCGMKLQGDYADFKLADLLRRDPKAIAPRRESDMEASSVEGLAFLHQSINSAKVALMADPADLKSFNACK